MKHLLLITIALLLSMNSMGQERYDLREKPPNALYIPFQPTDLGFGLRYDHHFTPMIGSYGSVTYGAWRMYKHSGLGDHVKLTLGALIPYVDYMNNQHDFSLGLNYHWMSGVVHSDEVFEDHWAFRQPWSFEVGLTIKFPRFALGFRTDVLRWEPCIDIGIPLNFKDRNTFVRKCAARKRKNYN